MFDVEWSVIDHLNEVKERDRSERRNSESPAENDCSNGLQLPFVVDGMEQWRKVKERERERPYQEWVQSSLHMYLNWNYPDWSSTKTSTLPIPIYIYI